MAADASPLAPPSLLLIEQTLILKYLRGIYAARAQVAPVITLFAGLGFFLWHYMKTDWIREVQSIWYLSNFTF